MVDIPGVGATQTVGNLVSLSATPGSPKGNPPELGEGNDELLTAAGLSREEISEIENSATQVRDNIQPELLKVAAAAAVYQPDY